MFIGNDPCCCEANQTIDADPHQIRWSLPTAKTVEMWECIHCNTVWLDNPPRTPWLYIEQIDAHDA